MTFHGFGQTPIPYDSIIRQISPSENFHLMNFLRQGIDSSHGPGWGLGYVELIFNLSVRLPPNRVQKAIRKHHTYPTTFPIIYAYGLD